MKTSFVSSALAILLLGGALAGIVLTDSLIATDGDADEGAVEGVVESVVEGEPESESSGPISNEAPLAPSEISIPSPILCHYEGKTYSEGAKLGSEENALECHIRDGVGIWERDEGTESPES